ncbi:DUF2125 domain-containing protein [Maricaulis sp.]|uniref:DUF2125 domain-containing protein n=1 Tax=Maricaulis sp. TaxID=1486257 RepID=UPI002620D19F|nr:DUF2125 domain-containing protein [Maricaulis sp.]
MRAQLKFILPIAAIVLLLAGYSGYWFYAAGRVGEEMRAWILDKEEAGYEIEYTDLRVSGFPYRFQIQLTEPHFRAPASDGGWDARLAGVQANALPYDFSHWIVSFDGPLVLDSGDVMEINASSARMSRKSGRDGRTQRIGAEIRDLTLRAVSGEPPAVEAIDALVLSGLVGDDDSLRLRVEANGLKARDGDPGEPGLTRAFGETAQLARTDLIVTEWAALARDGNAAAWSQAGGRMQIVQAQLEWGPAQVSGEGDLTLDRQARPDGRISLRIADPDALTDALVEGEVIAAANGEALRLATMLAPRSSEGVSLPFTLRDGAVYLGPVRLGSLD